MIPLWIIILGFCNLLFFVLGILFIIPKHQNNIFKLPWIQKIKNNYTYIVIILGVVIFHLIEVSIIDNATTQLINRDFTQNIIAFEGDIVYTLAQYTFPIATIFFVAIYIIVYPFTLWFTPLYFIITDEKKAMQLFSYSLLIIYFISLPFYLFLPITNVYTYYQNISALNQVIPGVEQFFYATTTTNNCLPSLHTAMTILIAASVSITQNKRFKYVTYFCAIMVIISVIYLAIHWITDVLVGTILALAVCSLLKKRIIGEKNDNTV